jgi:hypothetical protein
MYNRSVGDEGAHSLADAPYDILEIEVLLTAEVAGHLLAMLFRCDQDVAVQRRVPVEEGDRRLVFVDHEVRELGIAGDELADEAAAGELLPHGFGIHSAPRHVRRIIAPA